MSETSADPQRNVEFDRNSNGYGCLGGSPLGVQTAAKDCMTAPPDDYVGSNPGFQNTGFTATHRTSPWGFGQLGQHLLLRQLLTV